MVLRYQIRHEFTRSNKVSLRHLNTAWCLGIRCDIRSVDKDKIKIKMFIFLFYNSNIIIGG